MSVENNRTVCFFDSGIGGINLLYECVKILPDTDFVYFADNFNVPYGNLSPSEMLCKVIKIFDVMQNYNPVAAVVACNTVTANCIENLRQKYSFKIFGIQPEIKTAVKDARRCAVLATKATAESAALKKLCNDYGGNKCKIITCPSLAAYIEENILNLSEKYLNGILPEIEADSVVLGCTHYIFIKEIIKNKYNCPVFDGIKGTSANLANFLGKSVHFNIRKQKIEFKGGDERKNRTIFNFLLTKNGFLQ